MVTTKTPLTIKYPSHTVHETASGGGNYSPSDSTSGQDSDDDSPSVETPKDLLEFADIDVKLSATTLLGANTVRNFSSLISGQKLYEHPVGSRHGAGNLSSPSRRHEHAHDLSSFGNDDFGGRSFAFTFSQPYARENKDAPTTSTASTISEPSRPHSALGYHSEAGLDIAAPPHRRRPSLSASFTFTEHLRGDSTACFEDAESRLASDEMSVSLDSKPSPATLERLPQTPPMRQFEPAVPSTPRVCRVAKDPFPESVTNINYANLNGENENVTSEQDDLAIQDDAVQKGRYISVGYFEADEDDLPPTTSHVNQVRDHDGDLNSGHSLSPRRDAHMQNGECDIEEDDPFADVSFCQSEDCAEWAGDHSSEVASEVPQDEMDVRDNNEDAASDASWDDNASSASYDTLSNWAGESTGWPTESEDWSLTTNKRIVEARRMDALSPQESWDSALDRALLGSKVLGEHIEGPWDECPGSSRGGGGIIAGFWEGDAPPQYDDGSCCGDSDPMSSSHVSASSLYSDESPALTGGSTTGDSPSHASAVDPLEPKASYSVSEEELQLSQSTIIKALKEEKPRPLQYTYVNNGEYVPFDPDADPVARHTGWHPPRPDLPPITFLRPREGRFNLHGGRGFRLSSPLDSSKTKKSAGVAHDFSKPPTLSQETTLAELSSSLSAEPHIAYDDLGLRTSIQGKAQTGEEQAQDGDFYWPRQSPFTLYTANNPIAFRVINAVDGVLTFWDATNPIAYVELKTIYGPPTAIESAQLYHIKHSNNSGVIVTNAEAHIETLGPNNMLKICFPLQTSKQCLYRLVVRASGFMQFGEINLTAQMLRRRADMV